MPHKLNKIALDFENKSMRHNILSCIDTFYKLAGLKEVLDSLNLVEDVKEFVLSIPDNKKQHYIAALKKNPLISVEELKSLNFEKEKVDPYLEREYRLVERFPSDEFKKWVLVNLRKLRLSELNSQEYHNFSAVLPEIYDWYNDVKPNIASYSAKQAVDASHNWHEEMAALGEGKKYQEGSDNIVYGPNWKNAAWNGWTIRKVTTENDLQAEGNKMDHCVGGYCREVEVGNSTIYSLRDPQNEPYVTMEAWSDSYNFKQIMGKANSEPKPKYKEMIAEWFQTLNNVSFDEEDFDNLIRDIADSNVRDAVEALNKSLTERSDYGLTPDFSNFDIVSNYKIIVDSFTSSYRRGNYYSSSMGEVAGPLIFAAIEGDKLLINKLKSLDDVAAKAKWERDSQIEAIIDYLQNEDMKLYESIDENVWVEMKYPDEEDFEDREEYLKQMEEYEKEQQAAQDYAYSEALESMPWGLHNAMMEEIISQLKSGALEYHDFMKGSDIEAWIKPASYQQLDLPLQQTASINNDLNKYASIFLYATKSDWPYQTDWWQDMDKEMQGLFDKKDKEGREDKITNKDEIKEDKNGKEDKGRWLVAKYKSSCTYCNETINSGNKMYWIKRVGDFHPNCYGYFKKVKVE